MKKTVILITAGIVMTSLLQLGTIRKKEDPIAKTQTDPIAYKQKLEETKDGVKGAPTPSFNLYPKEGFMNHPPMEQSEEEETPVDHPEGQVTEVDTVSEDTLDSEDWWGEEAGVS